MHQLLLLFVVAMCCTRASAKEVAAFPRQVATPVEWKEAGAAPDSAHLSLLVALKHRDVEVLKRELEAVSSPTSSLYGKHWTAAEVNERFAPSLSTIKKVSAFFEKGGLAVTSPGNKAFVQVEGEAGTVARLLQADLRLFLHDNGHAAVVATGSYSLPDEIADEVDFVGNLHHLPNIRALTPRSATDEVDAMSSSDFIYVDANSNGPAFISGDVGDEQIGMSFALRCSNHSEAFPCLSSSSPTSITIKVENGQSGKVVSEEHLVSDICQACNSGNTASLPLSPSLHCDGSAGMSAKIPGFGPNSPLCGLTVSGVANFVPLKVSAVVTFASGETSDATFFSDVSGNVQPFYASPWVTPQSIKDLYGVPQGERGDSSSSNSMAVDEFLEEYYSPADLQNFFDMLGVRESAEGVIETGPNVPSQPGGEASLDIQVIMGIAPGVTTEFLYAPGRGPFEDASSPPITQEPFLRWIVNVSSQVSPSLVHSVSYSDYESTLGVEYVKRVDEEFMKLGLRGVSVLVASGDDGVVGYSDRYNSEHTCDKFVAGFPNSSPYVTNVGGTQLLRSKVELDGVGSARPYFNFFESVPTEHVCSSRTSGLITAGGGFSDVFERPSYQNTAVEEYFRLTNSSAVYDSPPTSKFNSTGRAYPDIAAIANNYLIVLAGKLRPIFGTSASTPTAAALFALVNAHLIERGFPPLGFANPLLYSLYTSTPSVYNDVVFGDIKCAVGRVRPNMCCDDGFSATPGWDPASGLGSFHFERFKVAAVRAAASASAVRAGSNTVADPVLEQGLLLFSLVGVALLVLFALGMLAVFKRYAREE
eukprot:CAMPEP_0113896130 /NCGR_PEP_ID=MMETSP0780_2-20120614/17809_1 /TAXON_ID=652834 /ORGANISM="Palpitomonas bilix" /LENGTH=816 /DNA_ID=CAMNT_0000887161 /DNA_START=63 /DNA_END=2513 /DNA_ORIENTATION=- /assembly_acc=CAM_ASM_000599